MNARRTAFVDAYSVELALPMAALLPELESDPALVGLAIMAPTAVAASTLVSGTAGDDTLVGSVGDDTIDGGAGNDSLNGGLGNDTLLGSTGNDTLNGGTGADSLVGSLGDDLYIVDNAGDILVETAGSGTDRVWASVDYTLAAGVAIESMTLTGSATLLTGNEFANTLNGGSLADSLAGGPGHDSLVGNAGADTLIGGADNDTLNGGPGIDSLVGGTGDDLYVVDSASDTIVEAAGEGSDRLWAAAAYTLAAGASVETLTLTGTATALTGNEFAQTIYGGNLADTLNGAGGADSLIGGAGNDTLIGGEGNDTLVGGTGADNMAGGLGDDLYWVDSASDVIGEASGEGADRIWASVNYTLAAGVAVESLTLTNSATALTGNELANALYGGALADSLNGAAGNDSLTGNAGADTLVGGDGNDTLNGGTGADSMSGGLGDDLYLVDSTADVIVEVAGAGSDRIWASVAYTLGAGVAVESITLMGTASTLTGNELANTLNGGSLADSLNGGAGNDTLYGWAGNDTLNGGKGEDSLLGGAGDDYLDGGVITDRVAYSDLNRVSYAGATSAVSVNLQSGIASDGLGGTDRLVNLNYAVGGSHNDILIGSSTVNLFEQFEGGLGNDTIDGGAIDVAQDNSNGVSYYNAKAAVTVNLATGTASGSSGNDVLSNINYILASSYADTLIGSDSIILNENFEGRGGNDTINGGGGFDRVDYKTSTAGVTVQLSWNGVGTATDGFGGTDTLISIERVRGSFTSDVLKGSDTSSAPIGLNLETFEGRGGNDTIDGGGGFDRVEYLSYPGSVTVYLNAGVAYKSGGGTETLIGIEAVRGSSFADYLVGNGDANVLEGGAGGDTLIGGAGDDTLDGGVVGDRINYSDLNFVSYGSSPAAVNVNFATGIASDGFGGTDTLANLNWLIGSAYSDTLVGSSTANLFENFEGGLGDDTIDGGAAGYGNRASYQNAPSAVTVDLIAGTASGGDGNDVLTNIDMVRGSNYNDVIRGSNTTRVTEHFEGLAGNDTIDGLGGQDDIRYHNQSAAVNVNLALGTASDGFGGTDTLLNIEGVWGSQGSDTLTGGAIANGTGATGGFEFFVGNGGNDTIDGGAGYDLVDYNTSTSGVIVQLSWNGTGTVSDGLGGIDSLISIEAVQGSPFADRLLGSDSSSAVGAENYESLEGRGGNDTIDGGGGYDRADYASTISSVMVNLAAGTASDGYGGTDTLINMEGTRGGAFNDTLIGSAVANTLAGGRGNDTLTGGAGNDTFVFDTALNGSTNVDQITDFSTGDRFSLGNDVFTSLGAVGALDATLFSSGVGTVGADIAEQPAGIYYDSSTGALYYDADGFGGVASVQFAVVTGAPVLTAANFEIRE